MRRWNSGEDLRSGHDQPLALALSVAPASTADRLAADDTEQAARAPVPVVLLTAPAHARPGSPDGVDRA